jgi:peptidoglycan/LPS O-acetylase OafA/YrhL
MARSPELKTADIHERFHSLDAVRACALFAGIILHAITSYLPGFREVNWPLADNSTSDGLGVLLFVIHIFRMSLFFIIAGFFARLLYQRLGAREFIKNRLRRIGLPLFASYLMVMPLTVIAIIWGARQLGIKGSMQPELPIPVIGLPVPWGHLWFLYLLLLVYASTVSVRAIVARFDTNGKLRAAIGKILELGIKTYTAPAVLAVPIAVSLFFAAWWNQWHGIPAPIVGLVPNLPAFLAYASAFKFGWFLHRRQDCLVLLAGNWFFYLVGALASTAVAIAIAGITPTFGVIALSNMERAIYAFAYSLAIWCWAFSTIGIAVRYLDAANARWRYLADGSYWMYLIHLPIVWLLQAWMLSWSLHWSIKLLLILAITTAALLASYHYLVRSTFMGKFLNGRKHPKKLYENG